MYALCLSLSLLLYIIKVCAQVFLFREIKNLLDTP